MKKLLSLLSVLTISGTAIPTAVAASPYQKQENFENTNNQQTNDELISLGLENNSNYFLNTVSNFWEGATDYIYNLYSLDKGNYSKEQIDFVNNNFFHKFNINFDDGKILGTMSSGSIRYLKEKTIIEDWTKYAKTWKEFEYKFPEIEFIGLNAQLGGRGDTKTIKVFKIPIKLNSSVRLMNYKYPMHGGAFCQQNSYIDIELFVNGKQLKVKHSYFFTSSNCLYRTWAQLKYNSIRLIGEVDLNPLIEQSKESYRELQYFIKEKEKELELKKLGPSYNKEILKQERIVFKKDIEWRITIVVHNFIQDLMLIEHSKKIENIEKDINEIKQRLDALEKKENCITKVFKEGGKKVLSNSHIAEMAVKIILKEGIETIVGSSNPIAFIAKKFVKGFVTGAIFEGLNCLL